MVENKHGPCLEENCSWCCDPVKVGKWMSPENIPVDEFGNKIWEERDEIFIPESHPDTVRLKTYNCRYHNKSSGRCDQYENRPDICKNSSCYDQQSCASAKEQHKKCTQEKFMVIKNPYK